MAIALWMMSPSTRAEAASRTFTPLSRPTTRPLTTTSSATISPRIVAVSPTVSCVARMSPCTVPSTRTSPEVSMSPVIVRSAESTEGEAFGRGAA